MRDGRAQVAPVDLVIPTVGRPSLAALLDSIAADRSGCPHRVLLVDDRPRPDGPVAERLPARLVGRVEVSRSGGRGPATARNVGWRQATTSWVAFLDDDVLVPDGWFAALQDDLARLPGSVAGSQGRIHVPVPGSRPPTDWERNVRALESARWATADMAVRRAVLLDIGGFDERFPRAYREDTDLGLRIVRSGHTVALGRRRITHPVRPAGALVSLRVQAGNADDPFMRALHGPGWRVAGGVPRGRRPWHLATVASAVVTLVAGVAGRPRVASLGGAAWTGLTLDLAVRRVAPGPKTGDELLRMALTTPVLPFAATWHWLRGLVTVRRRLRLPPNGASRPAAVLFDRDGTLVHDVPYNGDPSKVRPVAGARASLRRLRELGVPTAVVSNQSGIARGRVTMAQVTAVQRRLEELVGPLGPVEICPHGPDDGCACRKPSPELITRACRALGVDATSCVVIGDTAADVDAARAAGAVGILVPTAVTRREEVAAARLVAPDLRAAVELALRVAGTWPVDRAGSGVAHA